MNRSTKFILLAVLLSTVQTASAAGLKIKEKYDEFTKETYLESGSLKVCQPKSAGMAAQCATLRLYWRQSVPNIIKVRVELHGYTSITELAINVGGTITRYESAAPITGLENAGATHASSVNEFMVTAEDLSAISSSSDNGIFRVSGSDGHDDYDLYRKAGFGKDLPADKLREFVDRVRADRAEDQE